MTVQTGLSDLVGNLKDRFSNVPTHLYFTYSQNCSLDETNLELTLDVVTLETTVYTIEVSLVPFTILLILVPPPVAVATSTQLSVFHSLVHVLHGNTARNDIKR